MVLHPVRLWLGRTKKFPVRGFDSSGYFLSLSLSLSLALSHILTFSFSRELQDEKNIYKFKWLFMLWNEGIPFLFPARLERTVKVWKPYRSCLPIMTQHNKAFSLSFFLYSEVITAAARPQNSAEDAKGFELSICHFCCHNMHVTWWFPKFSWSVVSQEAAAVLFQRELSVSRCGSVNIR